MKSWLEFDNLPALQRQPWIPLRQNVETITDPGVQRVSKVIEYTGRASAAIRTERQAQAELLTWSDLDISAHRPSMDGGAYVASDVLQGRAGQEIGIHLVIDQLIEDQRKSVWDLHHDVVLALRLTRDGDSWYRSEEGWAEAARLKRGADGKPVLLEMRSEFLSDYLLARGMALYVSSYLERTIAVTAMPSISWVPNGYTLERGRDSLEGAVWRDTFAPPEERDKVRGALWRTEWFTPSGLSTRVRRDPDPSVVTFATDNAGGRKSAAELVNAMTYLHFQPELANALARYRGHSLGWFTRDTGGLGATKSSVHFGVNALGAITVFAKDVSDLAAWEQRIWSAHSLSPEGGVSKELFDAQMQCTPASTRAPEEQLAHALEKLSLAAEPLLGTPLFRDHASVPELMGKIHRFRSVDAQGLLGLAKDITRLVVERIDLEALCGKLSLGPKDKKPGSLKALEGYLATLLDASQARAITGPLFGLYDLRIAESHLGGGDKIESGLDRAGVDRQAPAVEQATQMLETLVATLEAITDVMVQTGKA